MRALASGFLAVITLAMAAGCGASEVEEVEEATAEVGAAAPTSVASDTAPVEGPNDFYVIAHMTNTPEAVRWAAREGANAVEIDVRFDADGTPRELRHGGICDCICSLGDDDHVCAVFAGDCEATSSVPDTLATIASLADLALVVVDSKIDGSAAIDAQRSAGKRIVDAIERGLFDRGYRGKVVIGAPRTDAIAYIQSAAAAVSTTTHASRISVAFDQMGNAESDATCTLDTLRTFTTRRAFGTGISACADGDFTPAIRAAAANERAGTSSLTYAWTLDRESSMRRYIEAGARAIITNKPKRLAELAAAMGKTKARVETTLRAASNAAIEGNDDAPCGCDCNYEPGGCVVAKPAPPGRACQCEMDGPWRCRGRVAECADMSSALCAQPDTSAAACALGGGDCEGY